MCICSKLCLQLHQSSLLMGKIKLWILIVQIIYSLVVFSMEGIAKNIPKNHKIGWMCPYLDESDSSLQWLVPIRLYYKWDKGGLIHTLESPHHVLLPIAVNPYFYLLWPAITFNLNIPQPPPCHPPGIWAYQPMTVVPGWMPKPLRLRNQCTGCFTSAARWGGGVLWNEDSSQRGLL